MKRMNGANDSGIPSIHHTITPDLRGRLGNTAKRPADSWLIGWNNFLLKYPNETVASMVVRDDTPLIAPYPAKKD